jgi:hypothetical protein
VSAGTGIAGANLSSTTDDNSSSLEAAATDDTYTFAEYPDARRGDATKLVASSVPGNRKIIYLKFTVNGLPDDATNVRSFVRLTRDNHHLSAPVAISAVPDTDWSESAVTYRNAPDLGQRIEEVPTGVTTRTVSFDVTSAVKGNGTYAFAVTSDSTSAWASFRSTEYGEYGPALVLNYDTGGVGTTPTLAPTASPTPTVSTSPSASPQPPASPTATPAPPAPAPLPAGGTLCGASFLAEKPGETRAEQLARIDSYYNGLEMVRVFYTTPPAWTNVLNTGGRTISISFKYPPKEIVAGKHDAYLTNWFKTAPRDQDIYWTYYHEPEDNIAAGEYTASDYRAAWTRLRKMADTAGNSRLRATLILMSWSAFTASGRNWRDYYPGRNVIQVLGWDAYNMRAKKGEYHVPSGIFGPPIEISRNEGLPFAIAETGSHLVEGDSGAERAEWVQATVKYLIEQKALFVAYFDVDWSTGDYRLRDVPGMAAWRQFCS